MYGQGIPGVAGSQQIQFPDALQQLNYVARSFSRNDFVKVEIAPIAKKNVCPIDDVVDLGYCAPDVALGVSQVDIFASVVPG